MGEELGADLPEALSGGSRDGKGGIAKPRDLEERLELGVGVGEEVRLVGEQQRGKTKLERIAVALRARPGGLDGRLPALGERHAALPQEGVHRRNVLDAPWLAEIHDQQRGALSANMDETVTP